jgi:uncharacterized membrane protein
MRRWSRWHRVAAARWWSAPLVNLVIVSDCGQRASARDRESAAKALREAFAAGRLTLDEFGERVDAVYSALTWGELGELTADLPEGSALARRTAGGCPHHRALEGYDEPGCPFPPLWGTVAVWLAIAAVAHVFAAIPLVLLSLYVLAVAHRAKRRRREDDGRPGAPEGCCRWREEPPGPTVL